MDLAAEDAERVRKFILKRKGEILADLTPEPPDWPEPEFEDGDGLGSGSLEVTFETTWGSNRSLNPFEEGTVTRLLLNESPQSLDGIGAVAGDASPDEYGLLPGVDDLASLAVLGVEPDGSISGMTVVLPKAMLVDGATLVIGTDPVSGGIWSIPPGGEEPDSFAPFTSGSLTFRTAGSGAGDAR